MSRIYTIGYEGADVERFTSVLKGTGIEVLADVRAVASSRKRGFSKNGLRDALAAEDIGYRHFIELGTPKPGRDAARAGDGETLRRIYCDEVLTQEPAMVALETLTELARQQPVCLLCFERDPATCHRRLLAERLAERGFEAVDLFVM